MTYSKIKDFGQNFLIDSTVIQNIVQQTVEQVQEYKIKHLIEIGPGKGAITLPLIKKLPSTVQFTLVEKDAQLMPGLLTLRIPVLNQDALTLDPSFYYEHPIAVVSNLPYSSSTKITTHLAMQTGITVMVLMFQREVAYRINAPIGEGKSNTLAIFLQNLFEIKHLFDVSPKSFSPQPKIYSSVLLFQRRDTPKIAVTAETRARWESVLESLFFAPRKMLRSKTHHRDLLRSTAIDTTKRPGDLDWDDLTQLYNKLK
jgi:16S rRNA (adenine1518-N6/adenine1519-N6)-dimethyltransferase